MGSGFLFLQADSLISQLVTHKIFCFSNNDERSLIMREP